MFPISVEWDMGLDPGVFGRIDLAALVQPHLILLFVCVFVCCQKGHFGCTSCARADGREAHILCI